MKSSHNNEEEAAMIRIMTAQNDNESEQLNLNVYHLPSETIAQHSEAVFKAGRYKPLTYRVCALHYLKGWTSKDVPLTEQGKQVARRFVCDFPELADEVRELRPELLEL